MKEEEDIKKELEGLSPLLSKIPKDRKKGYGIPKDYFSNFEDKLMSAIDADSTTESDTDNNVVPFNQHKSAIISLFTNPKVLAVAASILGLFLLFNTDIYKHDKQDAKQLLAALSQDETSSYILENIDQFDTEDLLEYADTDALTNLQRTLATYDVSSVDVSDDREKEETEDKLLEATLNDSSVDDILDALSDEELEDLEDEFF